MTLDDEGPNTSPKTLGSISDIKDSIGELWDIFEQPAESLGSTERDKRKDEVGDSTEICPRDCVTL
jgi:hypothetical protein